MRNKYFVNIIIGTDKKSVYDEYDYFDSMGESAEKRNNGVDVFGSGKKAKRGHGSSQKKYGGEMDGDGEIEIIMEDEEEDMCEEEVPRKKEYLPKRNGEGNSYN